MSVSPIVIIGTGLAGYNLAKNIRAIDPSMKITLITNSEGHFYSKPLLSTAISQKKSPGDLIISTAKMMAEKHQLNILTKRQVTAIDPKSKNLHLINSEGESTTLSYGKLVLAQGATPRVIEPLQTLKKPVYQINHWEDYQDFRNKLETVKHVAILGAGLVGCEFAHDLAKFNEKVKISIYCNEPFLMSRWLDEKIAQGLEQTLINMGVNIVTNYNFNNISSIDVDIFLSALGLSPNIDLAKSIGIQTHHGIVVNNFCQTSFDDIYAIGDCIEFNGEVLQFVAPLLHQAQKLAQTLCNNPQPLNYPPMPISLKTSSYPILHLPPKSSKEEGTWTFEETDAKDGMVAKRFNANNQLAGFTLSGKGIVHRMKLLQEISA